MFKLVFNRLHKIFEPIQHFLNLFNHIKRIIYIILFTIYVTYYIRYKINKKNKKPFFIISIPFITKRFQS